MSLAPRSEPPHARPDHPAGSGRPPAPTPSPSTHPVPSARSAQAVAYDSGLELDLHQRGRLVELHLAGDLDLASAGRLTAAMGWLRRRWRHTIVIDTTHLDFVDLAGYRALKSCLHDADGSRDPRIVYVVGAALGRLVRHLQAATGMLSPRLS